MLLACSFAKNEQINCERSLCFTQFKTFVSFLTGCNNYCTNTKNNFKTIKTKTKTKTKKYFLKILNP